MNAIAHQALCFACLCALRTPLCGVAADKEGHGASAPTALRNELGAISNTQGPVWSSPAGPHAGRLAALNSVVFAGNQNGLYLSRDSGTTWTLSSIHDWIRDLQVVGSSVYAVSASAVLRSTDVGQSWQTLYVDAGTGNLLLNRIAIAGNVIYVSAAEFADGSYGQLLKSSDGGATWRFTNFIPAVLHPGAAIILGSTLYVGAYSPVPAAYSLFKSDTGGASWVFYDQGLPDDSEVTDILGTGSTLYVATGTGVSRRATSGASWQAVNTGLSSLSVNGLAIAGGTLYAATGAGVFASTNAAQSWESIGSGLAGTAVSAVAVSSSALYAATSSGVRRLDLGSPPVVCSPGSTSLCLNGGRFSVTANFNAGGVNAGVAQVVQLTPDTGYLWFFDSSNVEAVVKVLDGCALSGHYWVFAGGLTNVNVVMTVTDTHTGKIQTYTNPANTEFQPIQDTSAFATCSVPTNASHDAVEEAASEEIAKIEELLDSGAAVQTPSGRAEPTSPSTSGSSCTASATALCLNNDRFQVTAHFDAGGGNSGTAQVVPLTTDTGYLWFFSSSNVEAVVKVLNGCGLNSNYWVFAGGLTNVNVVITVTDTQTRIQKTYINPPNKRFQPIQDTSAFATCSSGPAAPYGVDSHTVALYHFEDPPGNVVADATGVNPGVATGTAIVPSLFGHGRNFLGSGEGHYITVSDNPSLRGMAQMTIEAWVYPTGFDLGNFNATEIIVGRGDATSPYDIYWMSMTRNDDPASSFNYFTVGMDIVVEASGQASSAHSAIHHLPNQWYYIVGTYDGQKARVYVNGVLEQVGNLSPGMVVNTTDPLYFDNHTFFSHTASSNGRIGGVFDEIRISDIARSASEIAAVYAAAPH
ncbi:MAG TPA: LamG-like jellyroll fold domain-containing protein [Thermoanaerobaculia bacterium]|nr:LamG-like jellyroll fold domain-containing protein [Thermoanaerobaculia bacterium]